ncbi:hypothetical protein ANCCAN_06551 [Ancylostoma caninum]|uniref:Phlebovirus glycoprotein G2 fusion domain-containing protein n=1 Tax=Ancylostoma caninum TaxID=29170 RepID=A0A368GSQ6_ANCCA|nr:hypothetical protein ANCCAN_06551 [Ancylostoma caninum]
MLPELGESNNYPGVTRCIESCGGPGCGCFYLSSGCLFYRICDVPRNEKVYELFKCSQWHGAVHLELTPSVNEQDHRRNTSFPYNPQFRPKWGL